MPLKRKLLARIAVFLAAVLVCLSPSGATGGDAQGQPETPVYTFRIVNRYPHDPSAFTQGLLFHGGYLYESTGLYGRSSLRKVRLETGEILKIKRFDRAVFAEGIALRGNRIVMLEWKSGKGFLFDRATFRRVGQFRYATEGWGITFDGTRFIMSDGSAVLRFLHPGTFRVVKRITVTDQGRPVGLLNELEYVKGEVYANILGSWRVARISPRTGRVLGWIDLGRLAGELGPGSQADVLNGIAYDEEKGRLFVTGKFWPELFEIRVADGPNR